MQVTKAVIDRSISSLQYNIITYKIFRMLFQDSLTVDPVCRVCLVPSSIKKGVLELCAIEFCASFYNIHIYIFSDVYCSLKNDQ